MGPNLVLHNNLVVHKIRQLAMHQELDDIPQNIVSNAYNIHDY